MLAYVISTVAALVAIAALAVAIFRPDPRITEVDERCEQRKVRIENLEADRRAHKKAIDQLQAQIKARDAKIADVDRSLDEFDALCRLMQQHIASLNEWRFNLGGGLPAQPRPEEVPTWTAISGELPRYDHGDAVDITAYRLPRINADGSIVGETVDDGTVEVGQPA